MKRIVIVLLALMFGVSVMDANDSSETREKITIREKRLSNAGKGYARSILFPVAAYYLPEQSKIELYHDGIGDAEVYILDAMNQSLSQESVYSDDFVDYISVPDTPGIYYLIISSDTYYGEATFTVQ